MLRITMGAVRGGLAPVLLLAGVLTGCGESPEEDPKATARAEGTTDASGAAGAAKSGGTIGAAGSACELPITFAIAKGWKAKAVDSGAASGSSGGSDNELAEDVADALLHQGPVTAACEIDAKPAGNIGFLRVWTGSSADADARTVLRAFVAAEDNTSKEKYRTFKAGDLSGVEVEYLYTSKLLDEVKKERALAVSTPDGPVVLHLGGLDTEEHEAMLPAFELAKRTLRVA
ncbi:lipoprotein [Streptomyces sp. NPDC050625]|uniref:lipoprotein n=1 Tax=Streptomyces sp. NPDC050625 TaxID=3154629 RepID=UPI00342C4BB9